MGKAERNIAWLRERGVLPHDRIWVAHYFSHFGASSEQSAAFRKELRRAGFGTDDRGVDSDIEFDDPHYLHHWALTLVKASFAQLQRLDDRARKISKEHAVKYDGWLIHGVDTGHWLIIPNIPEFRTPWATGSGEA